jgi:hypothetical protein
VNLTFKYSEAACFYSGPRLPQISKNKKPAHLFFQGYPAVSVRSMVLGSCLKTGSAFPKQYFPDWKIYFEGDQ